VVDKLDILKKMFELADECLYVAKVNGRNQINTYFQGLKLSYGEKVDLTLLKQVIQPDERAASQVVAVSKDKAKKTKVVSAKKQVKKKS